MKQVKQGGRGVKTAYKDLKSKLSDRTPPKLSSSSNSSTSSTIATSYLHHSAPNSPVFNKRSQSEVLSINSNNHHKPQAILQVSNFMMNNSNLTNHINNNCSRNVNSPINNMSPVTVSPSPTNSASSSEMNILQELQQHALFKLPAVDRSVSLFVLDHNRI